MALLRALLFGWSVAGVAHAADLASYVLPLTGSQAGGNTFPGASAPFGMVKLGPDMDRGPQSRLASYSGYVPGRAFFTGFSMLHESGTGGAPKYGVVAQMPVAGGTVANPLARHAAARGAVADTASPGAYKATTASGVVVELAAAARAGLYQYTFPNSTSRNSVLVDVSHVLPAPDHAALSQHYLRGSIAVSAQPDGSRLQYQGAGTYNNGWNRSPAWTVYFCGYFDAPGTVQTFVGAGNAGTQLRQFPAATTVATTTARLGAVFTWDGNTTTVTSRVGVSFRSAAQACRNVDEQVPEGTRHAALAAQTRAAWNDQVLGRITTTDTSNTTRLQLLYSSLYHMLLLPQNKTGENPLWTSSEPYYDDVFTLWDLPAMYEEWIRSLVDIWRHEGFLPDARSSFFNGATQGGSNADNVLADAYVKGVRGGIRWQDAYAAMVTDAETTPPNNHDPRDPTGSTKEGRGALPDWLQYGFITRAFGRSVTRAVEYAVNDFSLYQVAAGLGKADDARRYLARSRNWRRHWNPAARSLGFSGFLVPRTRTAFIDQDPLVCGGCYWKDDYYEALPWEYSFNAHHDIDTLVHYAGGDATFSDRLATMFVPGLRPFGSAQFNKTIFNPGNEPSFTTPYLFHFVGRPHLSVQYSRAIADAYYHPTPGGLPGNSDAGAMESWLLWSMIGLYPITGQTTFLIGSPWFRDLTIRLGGGTSLTISSTSTDSVDNSSSPTAEANYVQSLRLNGQPWNQSWLAYGDLFSQGGTLEFVLGRQPSRWSTSGARPPSPATEATVSPVLILPTVVDDPDRRTVRRTAALVLATVLGVVGTALVFSAVYLLATRATRPAWAARSLAPLNRVLGGPVLVARRCWGRRRLGDAAAAAATEQEATRAVDSSSDDSVGKAKVHGAEPAMQSSSLPGPRGPDAV